MKKLTTKTLTIMAIYCAVFVILDRISDALNLFQMANGGKLNLGPIALLMCSYHLGWKNGLLVGITSVFLQLAVGSVKFYGIWSFLLDYLIAYAVYGLASLFPDYKYFYSGVLITSVLRLLSSTLSGTLLWETPLWASLTYNASYMIPTTLCVIVVVPLLCERLKKIW
ncbi:MAG: energy-coupled thiamine transporter ThiT [Erysipelotrichaceae bacterium]|nr:energy-coupled thiamine transporter ThiT [Erysipelotrichaceae bacterium]MBQ1534097.1 energy-coupled thiamine transporter ThiT [Erysipelotrichaceae bacterium]MBQ5804989.1 energy-coupled thiamine transporter ThiT [Erysipelotrichaceae bacterium]